MLKLEVFMKKIWFLLFGLFLPIVLVSCGQMNTRKDIELMGAGDRIHDTFTFANTGVEIKETEDNVYKISGSVERLDNDAIKEEFDIDSDINYVVAIKLSANGVTVDADKLNIKIDGVRSYDAEHLNGKDYTFIVLEVIKGGSISISGTWNGLEDFNYVLIFDNNIILK